MRDLIVRKHVFVSPPSISFMALNLPSIYWKTLDRLKKIKSEFVPGSLIVAGLRGKLAR